MKRLVWLVLAVFGAALAQVSAVELPVTKHEVCSCCGGCDMPDCAPPPATNPAPVFTLASPASVIRVAVRRAAPAPRSCGKGFFVRFESRRAALPVRGAFLVSAPAARVPLFTAHCSFLL